LLDRSYLGRLLLVPVRIQFHELGHALVAWLSSRFALPLPFGFTFWHEGQSATAALLALGLLGYLVYRSDREGSRFGVVVGLGLVLLWLWLSRGLSAERSLTWVIAGGCAGELVLSALTMVAFYFPLPDRLRWDFFRFVVLVPATAVWRAALWLWIDIARGRAALPTGTFVGIGETRGDLDRLLAEPGFDADRIVRLYLTLALLTGAFGLLAYGLFAWRALRGLREFPGAPPRR
jgi:hypothetical protein